MPVPISCAALLFNRQDEAAGCRRPGFLRGGSLHRSGGRRWWLRSGFPRPNAPGGRSSSSAPHPTHVLFRLSKTSVRLAQNLSMPSTGLAFHGLWCLLKTCFKCSVSAIFIHTRLSMRITHCIISPVAL